MSFIIEAEILNLHNVSFRLLHRHSLKTEVQACCDRLFRHLDSFVYALELSRVHCLPFFFGHSRAIHNHLHNILHALLDQVASHMLS